MEITLIHTVDIEDNKYYLNNIMEKVIPKSKTKLLQNFFWTFRLEEAFVSSSIKGNCSNLAKKIVRYKEHLRLYGDCEDRKLLPQGLYKESSVTFEDEDLRDVCQKFHDFASVAVRSKVNRHLDKSIHKMQNELQRLKEIARRDLGQERSELLFADIREKCQRLRCKK